MLNSSPRKLVLLIFTSCYLPGYKAGGPIKSISNIVSGLGDDFDIRIVTADRDFGDSAAYPTVRPGQWARVGKAQVRYLAPDERGLASIARILTETPHDLLFLNSFFDPRFTTQPLLAQRLNLAPRRPVLLAPRGEFSVGALGLKKLKKRSFMALARRIGLYKHAHWLASTEHEAADIKREFAEATVSIAACLPTEVWAINRRPPRARGAALRVVFLSRIAPMKNLDFALRVLSGVRVPVVFDIFGPTEDIAYWERCKAVISQLPPNVTVNYKGMLEPPQVIETVAQYDLFFLPTLGENFAHVIAEALHAGTRLLISDQTPWRGLASSSVGHDLPLNSIEGFVRAIEEEFSEPVDHAVVLARNEAFLATAFNFAKEKDAFRDLLTGKFGLIQKQGEKIQ
jgi:glycosyltransferase involved in cell wall biosynthesis